MFVYYGMCGDGKDYSFGIYYKEKRRSRNFRF
nr:MAG TPA: hypothetical protein [Caudoviricetes sp.]